MANPTCSTTCEGELPEVLFDNCNPIVEFSEIRRVFVAKQVAAPFADWTAAGEWVARIDPDNVSGDDYIREFRVIGDKPIPTAIVKDISNGRKKSIGKDHVLNFLIDDISDENYEFMRYLECGGEVKIWYETEGGRMFGGNNGINVSLSMGSQLNRGRDEIAALIAVATWRAKFTEERALSPIYDGNSASAVVPLTFDTLQTFGAGTTDTDAGVGSTVPATDADLRFEFNAISPRTGTDMTMVVKIAGATVNTVTFKSDYEGSYFKFTSTAAVAYVGNFINGTIDF